MHDMPENIDVEKIKSILPHRYPFLLVDRVLEIDAGKKIKALKNVTVNEPFFQGHFPNKSIMPGVLIVEAFAQVAALLGSSSVDDGFIKEDSLFYLVGVDKAKFRKPVVPGDQLIINVEFIVKKRNIWKYKASALVESKLVAEAELLTTVMD